MSSNIMCLGFSIDFKKSIRHSEKVIDYGTSGFRSKAEDMDYILYRMGMLAVLRSKKRNGETVGLMITASHNPDCDNGVKLIDPDGEMLEHSWESLATTLINAENDDLQCVMENIVHNEKININQEASVFIGRDTRSSSPKLAELAMQGVSALKGSYTDYGVVTTPVLHFMVYCRNKDSGCTSGGNVTLPKEMDYNSKLITSFRLLNSGTYIKNNKYSPNLIIDGSNGVGANKMKELLDDVGEFLTIHIYNDGNGKLNYRCGADYVKVHKTVPEGIPLESNTRCVSLDGDADRLIYFYLDDRRQFHMMDGDRIAILVAGYIMELIRKSNVNVNLGLVQTAYANGNSTDYISNTLQVPVACVPTGVKYLHRKAKEFDIGVYFEANGHGTVIYSREAEEKIKTAAESRLNQLEQRLAAQRLWNLINLTNQTVGDAISDLLLVETILKAKGWSTADWEKCYVDLPNRLLKVKIQDRNVIQTTDAERVCIAPEGLQEEINKCVLKFNRGRSFVRASGTEDVVRVYSEAASQSEADELGYMVASAVHRMAGGVGDVVAP